MRVDQTVPCGGAAIGSRQTVRRASLAGCRPNADICQLHQNPLDAWGRRKVRLPSALRHSKARHSLERHTGATLGRLTLRADVGD